MSLFSALTVAVGGLNAQSDSISNISDNIANASTVGFKRIDTRFESLVTQSTAALNDPGGVRATPAYQNNIQGNLVQSQSPLDLAISGNGFFNVKQPVAQSNGSVAFTGQDLYTRRGDFNLDKDGYMINGAGYVLEAHPVDPVTNIVDTSQVNPIQISAAQDNPVATTTIKYAANLPASATPASTFSPSDIQIYDALGSKHTTTFSWVNTGVNTWKLTVTPAAGTATAGFTNNAGVGVAAGASVASQSLDFTFQAAAPAGTVATIANSGLGNFFTIGAPTTAGSPATVSFPVTYPGAGSQTVTLNFGAYQTATGVTQFDSTNLSVSSIEQNGVPQGAFRDLTIDNNGFLSLNYDNGRSRTLYQVPLTTFNSPNNLQRKDGGVFGSTTESGTANTYLPNENGAGKIVSSSLEGSNTDIASEFTKMIQAQRVYSANAKTITTTDSMLQEVINIVR